MFTHDKKKWLRREHKRKDIVDCLVEEVFCLRYRLGAIQDDLNDVNGRLRYLEYLYKMNRKKGGDIR